MKILQKTLLISASLLLLAGAGCTQPAATSLDTTNSNEAGLNTTPANTNEAVVENTNAVLENTNTVASNTNDNNGETIDTSDWLTYTNEEYGFSFKYPKEWGILEVNESLDSLIGKEKFYLTFSNDANVELDTQVGTPTIILNNVNYEDKKEGDVPQDVNLNMVDFSLPDDDLKKMFLNSVVQNVDLERIEVDGTLSLRVIEFGKNMAGEYSQLKYYIPHAVQDGRYHMIFIQGATDINQLNAMIRTLKYS